MDKILISVIIPIFNPGPGIDRCIRSVRNQTLQDIEILLIDDCSTEDYVAAALEAAAKDERVRILKNEKNMGPGYSRNRGIQEARGECLSFIDADDYAAADFLELLYRAINENQADIAKGISILEREDGSHVSKRPQANKYILQRLSRGEPLYYAFTTGHQNAIYRREFILSEAIQYSLARRGEDAVFLLKACSKTDKIVLIDDAFYYYCSRSDSIMHSINVRQLESYFDSFCELVEYALKHLPDNKYTKAYLMDLFDHGIKEIYRYIEFQNMEKETAPYLKLLRSEWEGVPLHNDWAKERYSLYALQEYGYILPPEFKADIWGAGGLPPVRQALLLKRWINYFLATPKERKAMFGNLKRIASQTKRAVNGRNGFFPPEDIKQGKSIYKQQVKRLPLSFRCRFIMGRFKYLAARLYKKVIN